MTWIQHTDAPQATGELRACYEALGALYPPEYQDAVPSLVRPDGGTDHVTASHSLIPAAMLHAFSTLAVLLRPDLPLTRRQHEMIAAVVSVANQCFY